MVLPINPNWPTLFAEGMFGANPFFGANLPWTEISTRLYRSWSIRRGKQFELDLIQPGEFRGQWINKDGAFDPSNTSSPLAPGVVPFRGYRMRAQYPPTVNLLTQDQATGGEGTPLAAGTNGSAYGISSGYGAVTVAASGTAFQGTQVWQFTGATSPAGSRIFSVRCAGVGQISGVTYTSTIYARSTTTGANPTVRAFIRWLREDGTVVQTDQAAGTVTLTGNPSAAWTAITFTSTMPTTGTKVAADLGLNLTSAPVGSWTLQLDGIQWEQNSTASAWTLPGVNYPIYYGNIERYPQNWDFGGTYGVVSPVGVDALTLLSQITLKEAYAMDVQALNPTFFFQLNDPTNSTSFAEQAGRTGPAGVFVAGTGGTLTTGVTIASATPGGTFNGTNGPVVTFANTNVSGGNGPGTAIDLRSAGITGIGSNVAFSRVMAIRTTQNNTPGPYFASATSGYFATGGLGASFYCGLSGGQFFATVNDSLGSTISCAPSGAVISDGNWHLVAFTLDSTGTTLNTWVDGANVFTSVAGSPVWPTPTTGEYIGGLTYPNTSGMASFYSGDVALYAGWNGVALNGAQLNDLFFGFKNAWGTNSSLTETSGQRYSRILAWAGYAGASNVDIGATSSMGPATDVNGTDALSALQAVVDTEGGRHFVANDGTVRFQSRQTIFQTNTPMWVFGEGPPVGSNGEIPYTDIGFDYDTTRISNFIQVTQVSTSAVFNATDLTSQTAYGIRNLSRNNQSTDAEEVRSQSQYYLGRYKDPHLRIQSILIDVASNPSLFPIVLAFELGQLVQVIRRSVTGAPTITTNGFIEQITHTGDEKGSWQTQLQITPLDTFTYGTFTGLHATLVNNILAGATAMTITALPDAAVNYARATLSSENGFYIGNGLATFESGAIGTGGVQDQPPGYSTIDLTLSFPLTNAHNAGELVVFDWTPGLSAIYNYDSLAVFDSVSFAY